jgi:hypothetical protein
MADKKTKQKAPTNQFFSIRTVGISIQEIEIDIGIQIGDRCYIDSGADRAQTKEKS